MPHLNVHLLNQPKPEHLEYLRGKLDADIDITCGEDVPENVHILVGGRPTKEQLTNKPDLYALIVPYSGLPTETHDLMTEFPRISVHNLHHNSPMTAEMAIGLLIGAAKGIIPHDKAFRKNDWTMRYEENKTVVLEGKTALVLGYGSVGRYIGRICWAMGMKIIGIRRHAGNSASTLVEMHPPHKLLELLPRANVLIACLPGTADTEGMIGEKEIALLPDKAIIVNVGRGSVIDQKALYNALKSGKLHSAGIDVWYNYPETEASRTNTAPADHPFHELENVVMSPHRAGAGGAHEVEIRRMDALSESINAASRDKAIPNQVSLKSGY